MVIDYKEAKNQIETVSLADGIYTYSEIVDNLYSFPNFQGNQTWSYVEQLGLSTFSGSEIESQIDFYENWYANNYNSNPVIAVAIRLAA